MRFLQAERVFDGHRFLSGDSVLVVNENNAYMEIIPANTVDTGKVEKLKGVITPGFINAHCHLELSHLKGQIPTKTGLPAFGQQIITKRDAFTIEEATEKMQDADKEMWENGIVAVGDICNTSVSFKVKSKSNLFYHSFIELLGLHPERATVAFNNGVIIWDELINSGLRGSLAPHAPYSTSLELIQKIAEFNTEANLPSSIHSQESEDEYKFFHGMKNGFDDLYRFLKMDIAWFKPPMRRSLEYYIGSLLKQKTLLVHNTFTSEKDIALTQNKNIYWCFCPGANLYIENRLPDYALFAGKEFCLGTDSLASNTQLNIISEANIVLEKSLFSIEEVLKSITSTPAQFLNISGSFGGLIKNRNAGLNLIDIKNNQISFIKKVS